MLECVLSLPEKSPAFCTKKLDFKWKFCHAQHLSLYSDINIGVFSFFPQKGVLHFAWETSISRNKFAMLNIPLYSQISIILTMFLPEWLLLKKKCSDSKTKLKALFFSSRKPGFWIHKLKLECKLQIFHHLFLFLRYRRLWPSSLRKRCNL